MFWVAAPSSFPFAVRSRPSHCLPRDSHTFFTGCLFARFSYLFSPVARAGRFFVVRGLLFASFPYHFYIVPVPVVERGLLSLPAPYDISLPFVGVLSALCRSLCLRSKFIASVRCSSPPFLCCRHLPCVEGSGRSYVPSSVLFSSGVCPHLLLPPPFCGPCHYAIYCCFHRCLYNFSPASSTLSRSFSASPSMAAWRANSLCALPVVSRHSLRCTSKRRCMPIIFCVTASATALLSLSSLWRLHAGRTPAYTFDMHFHSSFVTVFWR